MKDLTFIFKKEGSSAAGLLTALETEKEKGGEGEWERREGMKERKGNENR